MTENTVDFKTAFEAMPGSFIILQPNAPDFTILAISDEMLLITGKERVNIIGRNFFGVYPENSDITDTGLSDLRISFRNTVENKKPDLVSVIRYDLLNAENVFEERYWSANAKPVLNAKGEILYIIQSLKEITDKIKAEKKQAALKKIAKTYDKVEVLPSLKVQEVSQIAKDVFNTGQPFEGLEVPVKILVDEKPEDHYFNISYTPLIEEELVTGVLHIAIDVTEQVKARRKIEESEQQVRSIIESASFPIGVYIGKEMRIQFANQAIIDIWGKGNDVINKLYTEILPELDNQAIFEQLDNVYTTGMPYHAKNQQVDLVVDGRLKHYYFNYSFTPLFDTSGNVYGVVNTGADVTDLNLANWKVEESEKNLRNIILQAPVAMSIFRGTDYVLEIANERMFRLLGKSGEKLLNEPLFKALPEVSDQGFKVLLDKVYNSGETYSAFGVPVSLPRNGGIETVYVNFVYEAFREGDGTISGIMVIATDVTEQVLAVKKIEEAEERARLAIESAELGTYEINLLTGEMAASPRMAVIFDVAQNADHNRYINAIHPGDLEIREKAYKKAYETGLLTYDGRIIHKDGSLRWVRVKGKIFYDKENIPVHLLGVVQDITEQKEFSESLAKKVEERTRELELANEHFASMNKELEQFTYAASHDMQEPLRKVQTFTAFLTSNNAEQLDDKGKNYLAKIASSVQRMKTIIDDLLNYSHQTREAQVSEPVDLNKIIEQIEADLDLVIMQKEAVILKDRLPQIAAVPAQMNQLFYNLFSNALKFSKPGVPVQIQIKSSSPDKDELFAKGLSSDHTYVKISFSDNGIGFEQEYAEQIFSLFKRLHGRNEYEGTGIGLGLCKKIVQNHKGVIWAQSEPGKGATFNILLLQ